MGKLFGAGKEQLVFAAVIAVVAVWTGKTTHDYWLWQGKTRNQKNVKELVSGHSDSVLVAEQSGGVELWWPQDAVCPMAGTE